MLSINQVLQQGRYHIINRLEHEENGVSYQAFDNILQTKVIIKETTFDLKASPNPYKYPIAKQMENLTSIKHELFTQIHGFFSEVDHQYLVTESVDGQNLKEILEQSGKPFPLFTVLNWTEQLLDALNYLHSKIPPIIHRDITPSNLTLTNDNKIKLLTYTIIKEFNPQQTAKQNARLGILQLPYLPLEVLWETLDYASQKVILNSYDEHSAEILESPIDERSDIYALGATIYHLVTGKAPMDALERSIELLEGKEDPLPAPSNLNPQIPRNVSGFLMTALEIRREKRFESALGMRLALQPMLDLMRKIELEKQKAVEDPGVIKSALQEVELARQALKRQKEEEELKKTQIEPKTAETEPLGPPRKPLPEVETIKEKVVEETVQETKLPESREITPLPVNVQPVNHSVLVAAAETNPAKVEGSLTAEEITRPAENFADLAVEVLPETDEDEDELFLSAHAAQKSNTWLIPAICVVVVLLIGGFFGFKFLNSNNSANNVQTTTEQKVSTETPRPVEPPTTEPSDSQAENSAAPPANAEEEEEPTPTMPAATEQNPNEAPGKAKKTPSPKPTPATAKTPVPKKKELTVDDLINDN